MTSFNEVLDSYYKERGLVFPNYQDAMDFHLSELGEVAEIVLAGKGYKRNNPECKRPEYCPEAHAEELGDAIMMLQVAGKAKGFDPLQALLDKFSRKTGIKYSLTMEAK